MAADCSTPSMGILSKSTSKANRPFTDLAVSTSVRHLAHQCARHTFVVDQAGSQIISGSQHRSATQCYYPPEAITPSILSCYSLSFNFFKSTYLLFSNPSNPSLFSTSPGLPAASTQRPPVPSGVSAAPMTQ